MVEVGSPDPALATEMMQRRELADYAGAISLHAMNTDGMARQVRQGKATYTGSVAGWNVERPLNPVTPATSAGIGTGMHLSGRRVVDPRGLKCHIGPPRSAAVSQPKRRRMHQQLDLGYTQ